MKIQQYCHISVTWPVQRIKDVSYEVAVFSSLQWTDIILKCFLQKIIYRDYKLGIYMTL